MFRKLLLSVLVLVLAMGTIWLAGCTGSPAGSAENGGQTVSSNPENSGHGERNHEVVEPTGEGLFVYAGAGIRPPLDELGDIYKARTGTQVDFSYKGSGCLLADMSIAKIGDLYIPGELFYMEQANERGYIEESKIVSGMSTVIIVQPGNPKNIKSIKDLAKSGLRLGFGDFEAVAAGKLAKEAMVKAGVFEAAQKNLTQSALNVVELGNAVKLGHIDAAIVWDATAALFDSHEVEIVPIEPQYSVYSPIPIGILTFSEKKPEAKKFLDFLSTDEAGEIFQKHGYSLPETVEPAE